MRGFREFVNPLPSIGRFAGADSIIPNPANPQDFNRYSYVRNNPLMYIDPTGHVLILPTKHVRNGHSGHLKYDSLGENLSGRLKDDWDIYHPLNTHPFLDELKEYSKENVELAVKTLTIVISFVPVMGEAQDVYDIGRAIVNGNVSEAVLIGILTAAPGRATALLEKGKGWLRAAGLTDDVADDVLRIADDVVGAACSFDADTLVMTEEGLVPISEIQVTDKVLAYDEVTGEMGYYPVTHVWIHDDPILIRLVIDGEVIWTTPEHPFYLSTEQWIDAENLQQGDLIRNADWQVGVVDEVVTVYQTKPMYNLTVDTAHTYFVGEQQWLVHNDCSWKLTPEDLGIVGELKQFDVTFTIRDDGYSSVYFDVIEGRIDNYLEVFLNIMEYAKGNGAHTIWVEGRFANDRLMSILERKYGIEFLTIDNQEIVEIVLE